MTSRGLRQGDPLSPYLFLFCAEALSALIRKNVEDGVLHGIRVCRRAPVVSNLFFADDTIIFGRATEPELRKVKHILATYDSASGQAINLNKSEICLVVVLLMSVVIGWRQYWVLDMFNNMQSILACLLMWVVLDLQCFDV